MFENIHRFGKRTHMRFEISLGMLLMPVATKTRVWKKGWQAECTNNWVFLSCCYSEKHEQYLCCFTLCQFAPGGRQYTNNAYSCQIIQTMFIQMAQERFIT